MMILAPRPIETLQPIVITNLSILIYAGLFRYLDAKGVISSTIPRVDFIGVEFGFLLTHFIVKEVA